MCFLLPLLALPCLLRLTSSLSALVYSLWKYKQLADAGRVGRFWQKNKAKPKVGVVRISVADLKVIKAGPGLKGHDDGAHSGLCRA